MIKVSVILPVYGVAEFIEKCTQSLLNQTLQEMEFIFVDDHGPDNSIELAKHVIKGHPREKQFVFLCPEHNLGAGMARNFAIPHAKGEYVAFVDSDDWVEPQMFEELYVEAKRCDSDLCCCKMRKCYPDNSIGDEMVNPRIKSGIIDTNDRKYILTHYVSLFASILYRRTLLLNNDITFSPDRSADDSYFVSCAWFTAHSVAYVDKPFYNYLIRPGSVCTTRQSDKYLKRIGSFNRLMGYAKQHNIYNDYKQEVDFLYIKKGYIGSIFNYVVNSLSPQKQGFNEIYKNLVEQIPDYKENIYLQQKWGLRIFMAIIRICPKSISWLIRWYASYKKMMI